MIWHWENKARLSLWAKTYANFLQGTDMIHLTVVKSRCLHHINYSAEKYNSLMWHDKGVEREVWDNNGL